MNRMHGKNVWRWGEREGLLAFLGVCQFQGLHSAAMVQAVLACGAQVLGRGLRRLPMSQAPGIRVRRGVVGWQWPGALTGSPSSCATPDSNGVSEASSSSTSSTCSGTLWR